MSTSRHPDESRVGLKTIEPTSGGVMVSKLVYRTFKSELDSHWVPQSCGPVLHLSKKLSKLQFRIGPHGQRGPVQEFVLPSARQVHTITHCCLSGSYRAMNLQRPVLNEVMLIWKINIKPFNKFWRKSFHKIQRQHLYVCIRFCFVWKLSQMKYMKIWKIWRNFKTCQKRYFRPIKKCLCNAYFDCHFEENLIRHLLPISPLLDAASDTNFFLQLMISQIKNIVSSTITNK